MGAGHHDEPGPVDLLLEGLRGIGIVAGIALVFSLIGLALAVLTAVIL